MKRAMGGEPVDLSTKPPPKPTAPPVPAPKPLSTIGDSPAAKALDAIKLLAEPPKPPVAASEAPKPVPTPPVVQSAPKSTLGTPEDIAKELGVKFDGLHDYGVGKTHFCRLRVNQTA